jgi:alpha-mannosidase
MINPHDYTIHLIGHGHIDPTWLWRWTEGYEEVRATFRAALDRMEETPNFKFTASSACFYAWVKACDPELFEQVKQRVAQGRWELAGGWWLEPDCNIPHGEAFVRHGLYGQRFFQKEFGVRATVGFNPDSFGHAGTFPQIYKKMGINHYCYQRPDAVTEMKYPDGTMFWWRSNDGTEILTCNLRESYNADERELMERIHRLPVDAHIDPHQRDILTFYGVGNHGGGPTRATLMAIQRAQHDKTLPKLRFSTMQEFFDAFVAHAKKGSIPTIGADLQHHARGCYTTHAEIKRLNRHTEHALMTAERWATAAWLVEKHLYPADALENAWKDLLYNQFHDILAGTSIEPSYEDARDQVGAAKHTATRVLNESVQSIAKHVDTSTEGNTVIVVNSLPWPVKQYVVASPNAERELKKPLHLVDERERVVAMQPVLDSRVTSTSYAFVAEVPGMGYRCYHVRSGAKSGKSRAMLEGTRDSLENTWWRIEFDPYDGHIARLYDKKRKVETLKKGNVLAAMADMSDTWSHDIVEFRVEDGRFGNARLELLEIGDVKATLRVVSHFGKSTAEQQITIYRDIDMIDCAFRINWQERYRMLKLGYETTVESGTATYDSAYGCQVRNIQGFEEPGQSWFDLTGTVSSKPGGFAVLNDCKYGFDVCDQIMRISMIRSPLYAHHDRGRVDASLPYSVMDQGWHRINVALVPHAGTWQDAAVPRKAWELNAPAYTHIESGHKGSLPQLASFLEVADSNIVLSVLKRTEEGGDLVIRGYETAGKETATSIKMPHFKKSFDVTFMPHEIKTLRIEAATWQAKEVNLLEE